ncbi:MAG TPA: hypothetical protein VEJ63_08925 [Planctomycetota bacterium]|nr:hypothetical protein [Planctomycetota bacterium]
MPAWSVGSVTYSDPISISDAGGLVAGKYWHGDVLLGTKIYERRLFSYPGVNGLAVKSFGYRGREISGEVVYLATSLANLRSAIEADRSALANTTFTTTPPDGSALSNCQLESLDDGEISPAGNGLVMMRTRLVLRQLR